MPTRRELAGGATVAAGALAVLSACAPPPSGLAPRRHTYLYRTLNGYRRDLMVCDATGRSPRNTVQGVFGRAAWTPDGKHIVVSRGSGDDSRGTWALWVLRTEGTLLHQITRPATSVADMDPAVAPDGITIAFTRDTIGFGYGQGIWLTNTSGTNLHFVAGAAGGITPCFNDNGKAIVYAAADGIRRIPTTGGASRLIVRAQFGWQFSQPAWSPDGKLVAFVRRNKTGASLCYVAAPGGAVKVMYTSPSGIEGPAWSRDSKAITFLKYYGAGAEGRTQATVFRQKIGGTAGPVFTPAGPPATDLSTWA